MRSALLSVSDKAGLVDFARGLEGSGSSSSRPAAPRASWRRPGITVATIEDFTGFPEIMDGRVKTLHPRLHGGILARARRRRRT